MVFYEICVVFAFCAVEGVEGWSYQLNVEKPKVIDVLQACRALFFDHTRSL